MQLIQLRHCDHGDNDAADSIACGGLPPQNENMQLNQLNHFFHEKNFYSVASLKIAKLWLLPINII